MNIGEEKPEVIIEPVEEGGWPEVVPEQAPAEQPVEVPV